MIGKLVMIVGGVRIEAIVTKKKPTDEQINSVELQSLVGGGAVWLVERIDSITNDCLPPFKIKFWNGKSLVAFRPEYVFTD